MLTKRLRSVPGARRLARMLGIKPSYPEHRQYLLEMLPRNSICAEIGVDQGDFSALILQIVTPKSLHLIDPWKHEGSETYAHALYGGQAQGGQSEMDDRYKAVRLRFENEIGSGRVKIHRDTSSNALETFPDGFFDWIYIDGNHLYEFVLGDLQLSMKKVKPGGYIAGDDYSVGGWWQGGVQKAVDEFVRSSPVELITTHNRQFLLLKQ